MENLLEDVKSKFISFSKDFATVELKLNDELSSAFGESMNPVNFTNRLKKLKERCDELEPKLKKLFECKLTLASILEQQLINYQQLEGLQKISNSKVSDTYVDIRNEAANVLDRWHSTYRQTLRHQLEENSLNQSNLPMKEIEREAQPGLYETNEEYYQPIGDIQELKDPEENSNVLYPTNFEPLSESLFEAIPEKFKDRCQLDEINHIYSILWMEHEKHGSFHSISKEKLQKQHGVQLQGRTGEAKLESLKILKVIQISNNTISLTKNFRPKPPTYPYYLKTTKSPIFKTKKNQNKYAVDQVY